MGYFTYDIFKFQYQAATHMVPIGWHAGYNVSMEPTLVLSADEHC